VSIPEVDYGIFDIIDKDFKNIASKIFNNQRISSDEGLLLFEKAELGFLGCLANFIRQKKNGKNTYFKINVHLEPSNICVFNCKFCSYSRQAGEKGSWDLSDEEIINILTSFQNKNISEIHITGGVNPDKNIDDYCNLLNLVRKFLPGVHIKAFSAVELDYIFKQSGISMETGLLKLKQFGLNSIPGGGAEIFDEDIRNQICLGKASSKDWLKIHETAHLLGINSNATMLYGHIENYSHRIDHLNRIRQLQDKTGGFNTFIPLKFRNENNSFSYIKEASIIEDLKNYAISRIYLDNILHIKAYWPMIGKNIARISLHFGVDDIDGTIDDSTKIYKMAGVDDQSAKMTILEFESLIKEAGFTPVLKTFPDI
jgi:aminodeoxyfutalosine synthase